LYSPCFKFGECGLFSILSLKEPPFFICLTLILCDIVVYFFLMAEIIGDDRVDITG
jgi:hypothetical protein